MLPGNPTEFRGQTIFDIGAFPEPPISGTLAWKVTQPWSESKDENERFASQKALELIEHLKKRQDKKD